MPSRFLRSIILVISSGNSRNAPRTHSIIIFDKGERLIEKGAYLQSLLVNLHNKAFTVPNFCRALIFLNFSDFETRIIFKLLLYLRHNIPIFVDTLLHSKTKQNLYFVSIMQR